VRSRGLSCAVTLIMIASGVAPTAAAAEGPAASAVRARSIRESAHLHRTSRHGTVVTESGNGSGTFNCPISLRVEVEEEVITFTFTCRTSSGSVSGGGSIHLHVADPVSYIDGTANLTRGTGIYAHVHANHLTVTGSVVTSSYATTLSVTGSMTF
jgi:hypothetical protein